MAIRYEMCNECKKKAATWQALRSLAKSVGKLKILCIVFSVHRGVNISRHSAYPGNVYTWYVNSIDTM